MALIFLTPQALTPHTCTCILVYQYTAPLSRGSFCISRFWLILNLEEPLFLSLRMWGEVNCSLFTTVGNVGVGATVLVCAHVVCVYVCAFVFDDGINQ